MKTEKNNPNVFLSLDHLLQLERFSTIINLNGGAKKSNSVFSGNYASKLRGRGLDFEENRPYILGDDIRNIDWKTTAKIGKTHTKVFTEEKEKPAFIFVDQSVTMGFGSTKKTKAVVAGELAAIFAHKIKKGGDRVGGMVYSGGDYEVITPKRDAKNSLQFFQHIVEANKKIYEQSSFDFELSLQNMMAKIHQIVTHDYIVFVISDFHRYSNSTLRYINELALHNDVVLVKVYDPIEEALPKEKIVLSDREKQISIDGHKKNLNENLKNDFEKNYKDFKANTGKLGSTLFKINTVDPVENQLMDLFSNYK